MGVAQNHINGFFVNFVKPWWQKGNMYFLDVIIFAFPCFSSSNLQRSCE
jgi:hypothetical protein